MASKKTPASTTKIVSKKPVAVNNTTSKKVQGTQVSKSPSKKPIVDTTTKLPVKPKSTKVTPKANNVKVNNKPVTNKPSTSKPAVTKTPKTKAKPIVTKQVTPVVKKGSSKVSKPKPIAKAKVPSASVPKTSKSKVIVAKPVSTRSKKDIIKPVLILPTVTDTSLLDKQNYESKYIADFLELMKKQKLSLRPDEVDTITYILNVLYTHNQVFKDNPKLHLFVELFTNLEETLNQIKLQTKNIHILPLDLLIAFRDGLSNMLKYAALPGLLKVPEVLEFNFVTTKADLTHELRAYLDKCCLYLKYLTLHNEKLSTIDQ